MQLVLINFSLVIDIFLGNPINILLDLHDCLGSFSYEGYKSQRDTVLVLSVPHKDNLGPLINALLSNSGQMLLH